MIGDNEDLDMLAAEYVLGTLDGGARAAANEQIRSDREFARLVSDWEWRLAPLADSIKPVEPPTEVWTEIERNLAVRQPITKPAQPPKRRRRRRGKSTEHAFWRWWTFCMGAVAASLAAFIAVHAVRPDLLPSGVRLGPDVEATRYVAVLNGRDSSPGLLVTVDPALGQMSVRTLTSEPAEVAAEQQGLELWLVAGEESPRSLGMLDLSGTTALSFEMPTTKPGEPASGTLAVSVEPIGGSPTGAPTGPVIFQGPLLSLEHSDP
ncbi:MAG: anti-sigma factor, partial [Pseudomonadota bacterium]